MITKDLVNTCYGANQVRLKYNTIEMTHLPYMEFSFETNKLH